MIIGYILICLTIINVFLFGFTIYLLFTPSYIYFIIPIIFMSILYLIISIVFFKYTNIQFEKEKHNLKRFNLNSCICNEKGIKVIEFVWNNKWIINQNKDFELHLQGYMFKKSFILAKIVREVRYSAISNQMKLSNLMNMSLKIGKIDKLIIRFINGKKTKEYVVVKNFISKNTILSRAITKSKYYKLYLSNRSYYKYLKQIEKINENLYLNE